MKKEQFDKLKTFVLKTIKHRYSFLECLSFQIDLSAGIIDMKAQKHIIELSNIIDTINDYIKLYQSLDDVFGHYEAIQEELESLNE